MPENVALASQLQAIQLGASLYDRAMQRERLNREEARLAEQLQLQKARFNLEQDESRLRQSQFQTDASLKKIQLDDMIDYNTNDKIKIGDYLKSVSSIQSIDQFDKVSAPQLSSTFGRNQFDQIYKNERNRVLGTSVQNAYNEAQSIQASAINTLSKNAPDLWIPVARLMDPSKPLFQQSPEFQDLLTQNAKEYASRQERIKNIPIKVAETRAAALMEKMDQNLPPVLKSGMQARLKAVTDDLMLTPDQKTNAILKIQDEYYKYIQNQKGEKPIEDDIGSALDQYDKSGSSKNRPPLDSFFKK